MREGAGEKKEREKWKMEREKREREKCMRGE